MHHTTDLTIRTGRRGPEALRRRDPGGALTAYKLSFGDGDADAAFWERLSRYCVQITSPDGAGADYEVVGGTKWKEELGLATLRVRSWDGELGGPTGEPFELGLTGDEEVHVY
jgi:hypothetical protein